MNTNVYKMYTFVFINRLTTKNQSFRKV